MMGKVHVYMCLHNATINSPPGNKTRLFPSALLIPSSSRLTLVEAFRNDYVAACGTALSSATEKNDLGG